MITSRNQQLFGIYLRIATPINKSIKLALTFLLRIRILLHSDWSKMRYFNLLNNCPPFLKGGGQLLSRSTVCFRWFSGGWSGWYVPGLLDMDGKFNTAASPCSVPVKANSMRLMWSYFYDHTHSYILCKSREVQNNEL